MSKGMLGMLSLSAVRGPVDGLYDNLASDDGLLYLEELKKFNRREPCWVPEAKDTEPKKVGAESAIVKPASTIIKPTRPFDSAAVFGSGWTIWLGLEDGNGLEGEEERNPRSFALQSLDLSLVEPTIILRRRESYTTSAEQINRVKAERAEHIRLDPCFALALRNEPEKYPEDWKGKAIFWDGLTLRSPSGNRDSVCSLWNDGEVALHVYRHGSYRDAGHPAALLASKHSALVA